jgi:uncharacterized NAD(P)/FAD-binding protein YdhS
MWKLLADEDKQRFLNLYQAVWMSYRVSIPVENARRLITLAKTGRLIFKSGNSVVRPGTTGFDVAISRNGKSTVENFDCVVAAFGSPRDARLLDSPLVQNLISSGMARCHPHGGFDVEYGTGRLLSASHSSSHNVWVLGELTCGVNFFTSALEINARHAANVARDIVASLQASSKPGRPVWRVPAEPGTARVGFV